MTQTVKDVMTPDPITVPIDATVAEAARRMKTDDIGDVLVVDGEKLCGIITDRDIVVRVLGEGRDPQSTSVRDIASRDVVALRPSDPASKALKTMRERSVRRLPVVDRDRPVGVVSVGDVAGQRGANTALVDISAAAPNN